MNHESNQSRTNSDALANVSELKHRWDLAAMSVLTSPLSGMTVSCLARYSDARPWTGRGLNGDDCLQAYTQLTFDELLDRCGLRLRQVEQLIEIIERNFAFDDQCDHLLDPDTIQQQVLEQRMRVANEMGLFMDYPVRLANFDRPGKDFCRQHSIDTLDALIVFISRENRLEGSLKAFQSMLAHCDQVGIARLLPTRVGQKGFHLAEALRLCVDRITPVERRLVERYHSAHVKRQVRGQQTPVPAVMERHLMREILECMVYFGHRHPGQIERIYARDFDYLARCLMYLGDPQVENLVQWLVQLTLGIFDLNRVRREEPQAAPPQIKFEDVLIDEFSAVVHLHDRDVG